METRLDVMVFKVMTTTRGGGRLMLFPGTPRVDFDASCYGDFVAVTVLGGGTLSDCERFM